MFKDCQWKEVRALQIFSLTSCHAQNGYFSSATRELSQARGAALKKLSMPLEAHDKAESSEIFLSFQAKTYLWAHPAETAYQASAIKSFQ